jgi:hypothetical protein
MVASKILSNSYKMAVVVVQSVPISTKVVSSNPAPDEMNLMQPLYVIKFFSDLRQVGGFLSLKIYIVIDINIQIFINKTPTILISHKTTR